MTLGSSGIEGMYVSMSFGANSGGSAVTRLIHAPDFVSKLTVMIFSHLRRQLYTTTDRGEVTYKSI